MWELRGRLIEVSRVEREAGSLRNDNQKGKCGAWLRYDLRMVVNVHKTGETEFTFVLSPQAARELNLADGSAIEIAPVEPQTASSRRYASVEEVMKVHREMEPFHTNAYRELAK